MNFNQLHLRFIHSNYFEYKIEEIEEIQVSLFLHILHMFTMYIHNAATGTSFHSNVY